MERVGYRSEQSHTLRERAVRKLIEVERRVKVNALFVHVAGGDHRIVGKQASPCRRMEAMSLQRKHSAMRVTFIF
jgi:hypothetical protein